ncbi:hypothetical protein [Sebaldella sp. S0638]|uniref:hypothetical protein n=1 Tax=Sebaldella sp. S0638 TaxID=2957809 RepID=UPI00209F8FAD|nr:hypothetical protein [Sebaldella sp. S0638]MCP1226231.1 hypothetical protein [Sebaldella sp. S0638]
MKKGREIIAFSIALNAMLSVYANSQPSKILNMNSDNMYNKMISNLNSGKSNDSNYKMLESILKKRNKELKDLYLQGDYIVKPEYLEWQIFATGFYSEKSNGDNTYGNAKYRAGTDGYYNENGEFVSSVSGTKPYQKPQEPKVIDLGMSIPLREISRPEFNIQISTSAEKPTVSSMQGEITLDSLNTPDLNLITFDLNSPVINPVNAPSVSIVIPALVTYGNGAGDTLLGGNVNINGTYRISSAAGLAGTSNPTKDNAIIEYTDAGGSFSSSSSSELIVDMSQRRAVSMDSNKDMTFTNNGKVTLTADETAGLEVQSNYDMSTSSSASADDPDMTIINSGTIEGQGNKQVAMVFTPEQDANGLNALENKGIIRMNGSESTAIALNGTAGHSWKLKALNNGNIILYGTKNFGIALPKNSNTMTGSSMLNDINGVITINGADSGGIAVQSNIESGILNKGTINVKSASSFGLYSEIANEQKNNGTINLSGNGSIGLRSAGGYLSNDASGTAGIINIIGGPII